MKLDTVLAVDDLNDVPATAREVEELGFDGLWTTDTQHNPMFPLVLASEHTKQIELGTAIIVAFARSPMDLAYQAWDLAKMSRGRFILGLGTQVKAHVERRFSMPWGPPVPKLREYVQILRHIWNGWQTGERINFRGDFYKITLMSPFFNPGPMNYPEIPVYLSGVNEGLCRLAGEVANGFHIHPYHTVPYLQEKVIPWIKAGADEAGRALDDVALSSTIFVVTGENKAAMEKSREAVRQQLSFYASTPSYRAVMELHGWDEVGEELSHMAARQRWNEMPALISDEMLETFAVSAPSSQLAASVRARYDGILDRVTYYTPFTRGVDEGFWRHTVRGFRSE